MSRIHFVVIPFVVIRFVIICFVIVPIILQTLIFLCTKKHHMYSFCGSFLYNFFGSRAYSPPQLSSVIAAALALSVAMTLVIGQGPFARSAPVARPLLEKWPGLQFPSCMTIN